MWISVSWNYLASPPQTELVVATLGLLDHEAHRAAEVVTSLKQRIFTVA